MKYKITDWIIACLILANMYVYLPFINIKFIKEFLSYFTGVPLALVIIRIALFNIVAITAAILFFRNSSKAKWALLGYAGLDLILRIWRIMPNSEQYLKVAKEAQEMVKNGGATVHQISPFPAWWVLALYVISLIYVFTLRERYKKV
jgi:glucan phosphoethanolaminetransferase (alkaline phosphatase superfamily)